MQVQHNHFAVGDVVTLSALKARPSTTACVVKVHPKMLTVRLSDSNKRVKVKKDNVTLASSTAPLEVSSTVPLEAPPPPAVSTPRVPSPTTVMQCDLSAYASPVEEKTDLSTKLLGSSTKQQQLHAENQKPSKRSTFFDKTLVTMATVFGVVVGLAIGSRRSR